MKSLALPQPSLQLYSLPVIKSKAEFVYKSSLSRYMHNQMLCSVYPAAGKEVITTHAPVLLHTGVQTA